MVVDSVSCCSFHAMLPVRPICQSVYITVGVERAQQHVRWLTTSIAVSSIVEAQGAALRPVETTNMVGLLRI